MLTKKAVKIISNDKIVVGSTYDEIFNKEKTNYYSSKHILGYMTNDNEFVNLKEAFKIASRCHQINIAMEIFSYDYQQNHVESEYLEGIIKNPV